MRETENISSPHLDTKMSFLLQALSTFRDFVDLKCTYSAGEPSSYLMLCNKPHQSLVA